MALRLRDNLIFRRRAWLCVWWAGVAFFASIIVWGAGAAGAGFVVGFATNALLGYTLVRSRLGYAITDSARRDAILAAAERAQEEKDR